MVQFLNNRGYMHSLGAYFLSRVLMAMVNDVETMASILTHWSGF